MEFRVWVDGTQRVVCGVKPTTTCQEIVFALAHATQQAGRFTMIERWRNNERLLSPNEQPLITLNRWGDHMKEVDFILKKTSTDTQPQTNRAPVNQVAPHNQPTSNPNVPQGKDLAKPNNEIDSNHHQALTNGHRDSPANHNQPLNDKTSDIMFQHTHSYNLNRRPQTVLGGALTSSSSTLNLGSAYMQANVNRLSHNFRPSLSASTLPNVTNGMTASPSSSASLLRPRYLEDAAVIANSPSLSMNDPHNGYQLQRDSQQVQQHPISDQTRVGAPAKNYPYEDLYSTINKKRINQLPPAVPAKPRLVNPAHSQHGLQPNNNAQLNYYQPNSSPLNLYPRPRHPPGYLEYLEAMANRNSLPAAFISHPNYMHQTSHLGPGNMFPRTLDQQQQQQQQLYNVQQGGASPASSSTSNQNYYPINGQFTRTKLGHNPDFNPPNSMQNIRHPINPKFVESSGLVINRGSAINVRLPSNSQAIATQNAISTEENLNTMSQSNATSVSQIGHDMLKIIEEQKKLLMNQKNELERLDNDQEYLDAKQSSEQAELINRIESEIRQLEDLWRENQTQINKLENQDFEKELEQLKTEQVRMEHEIANQKSKLAKCENDLAEYNNKIEQLEAELTNLGVDSDESISGESVDTSPKGIGVSRSNRNTLESGDLKPVKSHTNGSNGPREQKLFDNKDPKSSEEEADEDDSGGDASDDLGANLYESKLRTTKEVPYFEKRGLISGIRSLKLDKSRSTNRSIESLHSNDGSVSRSTASTPQNSKENKTSNINNNILEGHCVDSNGHQFKEKTANSNNYEFLMTL